MDNLLHSGEFVRHDLRGVLRYYTYGDVKPFAKDKVPELDNMRNLEANLQSWQMFKDMTPADLAEGIKRIKKIDPEKIRQCVNDFGFGDKEKLAETIISRMNSL